MEDWSVKKERFCALWQNEVVDRCCIRLVCRTTDSTEPEPIPVGDTDRKKYWLDGEWILKREMDRINSTMFLGEAFPNIFPNFGAAGHAAFFKGVKVEFGESIWMQPANMPDSESAIAIEYDEASELLQKTYQVIEYLVQESKGRYFVALPDISGNLDALAHIRGNDLFLLDLAVQQDNIQTALQKIMKVWKKVITDTFELTKSINDNGSTIGWLDTWAPGFHVQLQSDISVMISQDMFEKYVLPELEEQCAFTEFPLYHLDGMEQIRHLDMLLGIKNLKMIQWTNVAGQPSPIHFIPVFKRIQDADKSLLIRINNISEIPPIMNALSSRGLYIYVEQELDDMEQARKVMQQVAKRTHD